MAEEKKITEEIKEEIKEELEEEAAKNEEPAEELKEEIIEEAAEPAAAEVKETADSTEPAMLASTENKRKKKAERRDAKAARKAANKVEEKKSRPNNGLLAVLIFGVVIAMFVFVGCYNYFSKPASIEKYLEDNGGKDVYGEMMIDEHTTAAITAKGNDMTIDMTVTPHEGEEDEFIEYYEGDDGEDMAKYITAYFLTTIKPEVRGFSANSDTTIKVGDKEVQKLSMSYKEAKEYIEEQQEEAEADADDAEDAAEDAAENAEDAAEDAAGDAAEADD